MRGTAAVLALLALGAGCSGDKSFALVSVTSTSAQFNDVTQLRVDVDNGTYHDTRSYPATPGATTYRFDEMTALTFSVSFRSSSHMGDLVIGVTTLNAAGAATGYGKGSAPIDRDHVTKVEVRVTRGVAPPPPVDGGADGPSDAKRDLGPPCDPMLPAASTCAPGQTCIVGCKRDNSTAGMCVMAGNKAPGAACNDDCVLGAECFTFNCTAGPVRACLRLCKDDGECAPSRCSTIVPCGTQNTPYKTCGIACDPVGAATTGCAPGLACFLFAGESPDCDCPGGKRTGDDGTPCQDSDTCKPGMFCVSMAGAKTCRPLCRLDAPQCAAGHTCTHLIDPDYKTFGACLP
jgi:hypothetical protein